MPSNGVACIYCFYNPATGKSYIGMTTDEERRHFSHLRSYEWNKRKSKFYNALRKYGWHAFEYRVLAVRPEGASDQWLVNAERLAIKMYDSYRNGYNMTPGGEFSPMHDPEVAEKVRQARLGKPAPEKIREILRTVNIGRRATPEQRRKMSEARKGKQQSADHARKRCEAIRGPKNGMYGKDFSEEHRRKISESLRGSGNGMYGKKHSEETRAKLRAKRALRITTAETRAKLSAAHKARYAALRAQRNTQPETV